MNSFWDNHSFATQWANASFSTLNIANMRWSALILKIRLRLSAETEKTIRNLSNQSAYPELDTTWTWNLLFKLGKPQKK